MKTGGIVTDESWDEFGIRQLEWSTQGLLVNGKSTLLRGACIHSDNGILGACSYAESEERRIRILKKYGYNAIRSAHNPAAEALLKACDMYGMYVMDETWDVWYSHKSKYDYATDFEENYKLDILGHAGAEAEYAAVVWGVRNKPYLGVQPVNHPRINPIKAVWRGSNALPSWSWCDCAGNPAVVEVYADADSAELFLNGQSLGQQKIEKYKTEFEVTYIPGKLSVVVYNRAGERTGKIELLSAKEDVGISLLPDDTSVKAGEIVYIDVLIADTNGVVESNADSEISLSVDGGELLAFGSACPRTEESYVSGKFTTYYGRAQAVVRAFNVSQMAVKAVSSKLGEKYILINVI